MINPIFSKIYSSNTKSKYVRKLNEVNQTYQASFYYYNMYPPANFLLFALDELKTADVCASGILTRSDPLHIILKRIILTGYPYKIHKRKAVCRLMFFNPLDIKYF